MVTLRRSSRSPPWRRHRSCLPPASRRRPRKAPASTSISSVISTKVRAKIADDPMVKITDIDVNAFKDTVQLSGFVNTPEEKARAGRIAASIEGVRRVENNITVK